MTVYFMYAKTIFLNSTIFPHVQMKAALEHNRATPNSLSKTASGWRIIQLIFLMKKVNAFEAFYDDGIMCKSDKGIRVGL